MILLRRSRIATLLSFIAAILALYASVYSLTAGRIYQEAILNGVFSESLLPGTLSQDIITIPVSLGLVILALFYLRKADYKLLIVITGMTAYLFYAYGLFTISGAFTSLYLVYLAIFGLSIYSIIFGVSAIRVENTRSMFPKWLRRFIAFFLLFVAAVFAVIWVLILIPNISSNTRPAAYAVFVIDLAMVLPGLAVTGILLLRNRLIGLILAGVALVIAFTLISSVLLGESLAPLYGMAANTGMIIIYGLVTGVSLLLGILYFSKLILNIDQA